MKHPLCILAFATLSALSPAAMADARPAASNDQVEAENIASAVAVAFSNDGFKLRDGHWTGALAVGKPQLIQVNLYAGNEYWFSLGATAKAKKVAVTVFDETGKPIECEPSEKDATAAAGFAPGVSGPSYIRVELLEGDAATFCLLYSYK